MSLNEFDYVKMKFSIKNGAPNLSKANWWYEKNPFALFLLNYLKEIDAELQIETKEEWREFYPIFKHYFPSLQEYNNIKNNVAFWNGESDRVMEDSFYIKWVILNRYGVLNYRELQEMPFREAMSLYYYSMLNNIYERADKYRNTMFQQLRQKTEGKSTEMYR